MITTITLNPAIDKRYVVEDFVPYEVQRVQECTWTAGGKGLNVAKVAGLLGEKVLASGFVGGHSGQWILEELDRLQVSHDFVKVGGETRTCINIQDRHTGKHTEFLEPGAPITPEQEKEFLSKFEQLAEKSQVITVSGSIPKGADPQIYSRMTQICHRKEKPIFVDTSGSLLLSVLDSRPTLIKPNTDELEQILGRKISSFQEVKDCAGELRQRGIPLVAISLGKDGVLVACEEGMYKGNTPDIPVVNTVGCGDSMLAGFAVGYARGLPIEESICLALAVSTANALTRETGWFQQEDLDRLLSQVSVEKL